MPLPARRVVPLLGICLLGSSLVESGQPDRLPTLEMTSAEAVAARVDGLIEAGLRQQGVQPLPETSDEDFLRRVTLDLAGRIPTPQDVTLFGLTPGHEKRGETIGRLLESEDFARTWASYWREVIYSRATDVRSRIAQPVFEDWMAEQLQADRPWDEITTELLTATGNTREEGSTALIFAQGGDPTEIAGEVSRIFLGIQIQCANCHDHPYDQWKREDFHELAAFFPRIRLRRDANAQPPTFSIESADNERDNRGRGFDAEQLFRFLDRNRDGRLTKAEAQRSPQFGERFAMLVEIGDKDADGAVSLDELKQVPRPDQNQPGRGTAEYYMPDLENPAEPGTRTEPVFFINDRGVPLGTRDQDRRGALAKSVTSPLNPWFARAFVNRIWSEMLGAGFYSPVDDMGPERSPQFGDVLDVLASGFTANDYDVKWVYRTIALTTAYQRSSQTDAAGSLPAFAAASPTRLRGDQLYNALTQVLGVPSLGGERSRGPYPGAMRGQQRDGGRFAFGQLFNYDPSTPQSDLLGDIPQALFMMNSPVTGAAINGRGLTSLGRILREFEDDPEALSEIYLRVLSREPTPAEVDICRKYIADVGDRMQAFEDILWGLMNSTEFLTKR